MSFIIALLTSALVVSGALDSYSAILENPALAGNVYSMYNHDLPPQAKAPKGYKPFYISHYGRHGARNIESSKDLDKTLHLFDLAYERGLLTPAGAECREKIIRIHKAMRGAEGNLTSKGVAQQKIIAGNLYKSVRPLLSGSGKIDAISSITPRCILTMAAFCGELSRRNPKLDISMQSGQGTMPVIHPFCELNPDISPDETGSNNHKAVWQKTYKKILNENLNPDALFRTLFTDTSFISEVGDPISLENRFFYLAECAQCGDIEGDASLWEYIPEDELCHLWECNNYRYYISRGPDTLLQHGRQWSFVYRTLEDMVSKAENDIASGQYCARLRFGHDIIMMSLLNLLDAEGFSTPVNDFHAVKDVWQAYDFPMSLNLQMIFYRNRKGDVIVRLLYNERDIRLPIKNCGTEYFYHWNDFRTYAAERISFAKAILKRTGR